MGDYKTSISGKRYQYQITLEEIKEEWKNLETTDLHNIKNKQDQSNRAISDSHFWSKKKIILLKLKKKILNIKLLLLKWLISFMN